MSDKNGAERLCEVLRARGVTHVLGIPGTQNLALWEAVRTSGLTPVLTTTELAAAFMANGYHRASGRIAPVATIPGPGFTFALTGVAEAAHDSAGYLHLVGSPPPATRPHRFQSVDQRAMAAPIVKGVVEAARAEDVAAATARAFDLAAGGEPGPVMLSWTEEALEGAAGSAPVPAPAPAAPPDPAAVAAIAALAAAGRTVIYAGQGAAGAAADLARLAERLHAPVLTSTSGRGVLPEDHPLALGFEPVKGGMDAVNALLAGAGCVLVVGAKLCEAGTSMFRLKLPEERLARIDASAEVLAANYPARHALAARAEDALPALLAALPPAPAPGFSDAEVAALRAQLAGPGVFPEEPRFTECEPSTAARFFGALRAVLPREAILVTDSGLHQTMLRRHTPVLSPRGLIVPSDFQSMAFGLPAAIGACLAAPDRPVVAVIGDGGFAMTGLELLTAVREKVRLTVIVLADRQLNRIRMQQLATYGKEVAVNLLNPDFEAMALGMGAGYLRAGEDLAAALRSAVSAEGVNLVEVVLGDPAEVWKNRAKGVAKGLVRGVFGRGGLSRIKNVVGR
ncbi:MAG: thiamine pyrophosphate-binding protein [Anaeromyxobacter sp.]